MISPLNDLTYESQRKQPWRILNMLLLFLFYLDHYSLIFLQVVLLPELS